MVFIFVKYMHSIRCTPLCRGLRVFYVILHEDKRLVPGTIPGFKSAIVHTVAVFRGVRIPSFVSSDVFNYLLDSFKHLAPSRAIRCPSWDPILVLAFFTRQMRASGYFVY